MKRFSIISFIAIKYIFLIIRNTSSYSFIDNELNIFCQTTLTLQNTFFTSFSVLPSSIYHCDSLPTSQISSDGSLGRMKSKYHLRDLFIAPSFDELDAVAVDGKGEPRKLSGKQLEYIRERG